VVPNPALTTALLRAMKVRAQSPVEAPEPQPAQGDDKGRGNADDGCRLMVCKFDGRIFDALAGRSLMR
jgi:hypothetical protein